MANKYEYVERVKKLLDDENLGQLQKRLSATEASLNDILKKINALEAEKIEREALLAAQEALRAEEEAKRLAEEEQAKAEAERLKAEEEAKKLAEKEA